jgi:hypothetical protein
MVVALVVRRLDKLVEREHVALNDVLASSSMDENGSRILGGVGGGGGGV